MFAYPRKAEFNRVVPKTKIFAHARPSRRVKELYAAQVDQIIWKYKLAPETLNLPAKDGITEIQVFEIKLRMESLEESVLTSIDKAIPFPLLFHLVREQATLIQFVAAYKRPSDADTSRWVTEAMFHTDWQPSGMARPPLPVCLDLAALYALLVRQHLPISPRSGESLGGQALRFLAIQTKEKQCRQLERRLDQENQFNRKVELNAQVRTLRRELDTLHHP